MARVLNFGSLNSDHVYAVDHFVTPGETISCTRYQRFPGGKGLNQSIALAHAGADVAHAGCIGPDGAWLEERLRREGVDTGFVQTVDTPTGHAVIQVSASGENAIVIYAGANGCVSPGQAEAVIQTFSPGDFLLIQNEISALPNILRAAHTRGLRTAFNPAPMDAAVSRLPLDLVDLFIVNETEALALAGSAEPGQVGDVMHRRFNQAATVLTLGAKGAWYLADKIRLYVPPTDVTPRDTTAAGDTFTGFFLHTLMETGHPETALLRASRAAEICITRDGAADSIPAGDEVE